MADAQVSAYLSEQTREQLERYAKAHGLKKGHLVEEAIKHHLQALRELPADIIIPPALELTADAFERVTQRLAKPRKPTAAMTELMASSPASSRRKTKKKAR